MRAWMLGMAALAACAGGPQEPPAAPELPRRAGIDPIVAARAAGVVYTARGEGFSVARYRDEHIVLTWDGQEHVFFNPRLVLPAYRGEIYEARNAGNDLQIQVRTGPCLDRSSGETWSAAVTVRLDGVTRTGCGRPL